jgi:hypothetical protein
MDYPKVGNHLHRRASPPGNDNPVCASCGQFNDIGAVGVWNSAMRLNFPKYGKKKVHWPRKLSDSQKNHTREPILKISNISKSNWKIFFQIFSCMAFELQMLIDVKKNLNFSEK